MKYLALPADRKEDINQDLEAYEAQLLAEKQRKRERSNANLQPGDHTEYLQPGSNGHNTDESLSAEALARKHRKRGERSEQCSQCGMCGSANDLLGSGGRHKAQWRKRCKDPAATLICLQCSNHRQRCAACKKNHQSVEYCRDNQGHTATQ